MSAFLAVIRRRPSARILLPAYGGMAVAAARLGAADSLEHARREVAAQARAGGAPYDVASAMLDLARAYVIAGHRANAEMFRHQALEIATRHGFHEIEHHSEALVRDVMRLVPQERILPPSTATVAGALRVLAGV
jgi:hypothetical protein